MTDYSRLATENFQQLNLSRVIQIVRGDAVDVLRVGPARPPAARADARRGQAGDDVPQQPVLLLEQRHVASPGARVGHRRQGGPVAARAWERERCVVRQPSTQDRKSTRLNSSHEWISYAVFCLKKKKKKRLTS